MELELEMKDSGQPICDETLPFLLVVHIYSGLMILTRHVKYMNAASSVMLIPTYKMQHRRPRTPCIVTFYRYPVPSSSLVRFSFRSIDLCKLETVAWS